MCFRYIIYSSVLLLVGVAYGKDTAASHAANSLSDNTQGEAYNRSCLNGKNGIPCQLNEASLLADVYASSASTAVRSTAGSSLTLKGKASITTASDGQVQIASDINVTPNEPDCPSLSDADSLTQTQLINRLTASCRYDRLQRPSVQMNGTCYPHLPVQVHTRTYIYAMQILESSELQFKVLALLQLRFDDPRLAFERYAPKRTQAILGEAQLRDLIWAPHIFLSNEHNSAVLGTNEKDILTMISPNGTVIISMRIQATLSCWMDLRKFPFDEQQCSAVLESWMYNTSDLQLHWERNVPISFDSTTLTEYMLEDAWSNETLIVTSPYDLRHGAFVGNYSALTFTLYLTRETGYYMMDYFLPSMMIVAISWVSFWLQADQTPARTTLGTSTLLSFITLASSQEKNLPKVSYIKVSEIWFFGCTFFIFGSLVEFAFVNTIWRRNRNVEVRKVNTKYVLKSTLTPRKKISTSSIDSCCSRNTYTAQHEPPIIITDYDVQLKKFNSQTSTLSVSGPEDNAEQGEQHHHHHHEQSTTDGESAENKSKGTFATMTPHEVSLWIDRKARFAFPLAFIVFNAFFWLFVYCL